MHDTMIPRILTKQLFCHIFAPDGDIPLHWNTLYERYILPIIDELEITPEDYKSYSSGIPYKVNRKLIEIHSITEEEIKHALEALKKTKQKKRKATIRSLALKQPDLFSNFEQ